MEKILDQSLQDDSDRAIRPAQEVLASEEWMKKEEEYLQKREAYKKGNEATQEIVKEAEEHERNRPFFHGGRLYNALKGDEEKYLKWQEKTKKWREKGATIEERRVRTFEEAGGRKPFYIGMTKDEVKAQFERVTSNIEKGITSVGYLMDIDRGDLGKSLGIDNVPEDIGDLIDIIEEKRNQDIYGLDTEEARNKDIKNGYDKYLQGIGLAALENNNVTIAAKAIAASEGILEERGEEVSESIKEAVDGLEEDYYKKDYLREYKINTEERMAKKELDKKA